MSAKAADLHSYRVVGFWQSTNGKKSRSAMGQSGLRTQDKRLGRSSTGTWKYGGYPGNTARIHRVSTGERTALSISDLTGCLPNSWQRHSAYGCRPARSRFDHCMRKLRSEATNSGTRERHPTHSSLHPVRMNYCPRSQREQVLMEWT